MTEHAVNTELRIRLMGGLSVDGMSERDLGSRKARTLLKLLAVARGEVVPVDRAADVLWGLELPAKPAEQVGVLVSRLRGVLGADHLIHRSGGYALAAAWLDIDEIDRRVEEASDAQSDGRLAVARAAADAALALVRGPLLPDEDGEWADVARQRCETQVAAARRIKIEATLAAGDWAARRRPGGDGARRAPVRRGRAPNADAGACVVGEHGGRARRVRQGEDPVRRRPRACRRAPRPNSSTRDCCSTTKRRSHASGSSPRIGVPGTDAELARLDHLLDDVGAGRSTIVAIEGEAGIGKSTLVAAWLSGLDRNRVFVAEGRCDELGRDLPLAAVADAVAAAVRMAEPGALDGLSVRRGGDAGGDGRDRALGAPRRR